jgi:O-antigen/teichoic acid export membrane protein
MSRTYLATGTTWILGGMLAQRILGYVSVILVLRFVDVSVYGTVVFLLSWLAIPVTLASQGLPVAATRLLSQRLAAGDAAGARAVLNEIKWLVLAVAGALALAAPLFHSVLPAEVASAAGPATAAALFIALVLVQPLLNVDQFAALGLKDPRLRALVGSFLPQLLRLGCVLAIVPFARSAQGLVAAHVAGLVAALFAAELLLARRGFAPSRPAFAQRAELYRFSLPLLASQLLALGVFQADKLCLGYLTDPGSLGLYAVASKLAFLAIAPAWAASQTLAPIIAERWSSNRIDELRHTYQRHAEVSLLVTGVAVAAVLVNVRWLLGLFGPELVNADAIRVTQLLSLGLLLSVLPGSQAQLYRMSGRTYLATLNAFSVAVLNVTLNVVLIQRYGVVGAAAATAISLAVGNLSGFVYLKLFFGFRIHPFGERYWVSLAAAAGLVALGLSAGDRVWLGNLGIAGCALATLWLAYRPDLQALARGVRRAA